MSSGGTPPKANPRFWVGDIPFVSARDLKCDRIERAVLHISSDAVKQSAAKLAPVGSLLMLVRGMGLANGMQIGEVTAPVAFNQDVRALVPTSAVLPRFLLLALRSHFVEGGGKRVLSTAAHGTLKIDADGLRQIPIPVPPLTEQQRIVDVLDKAFADLTNARANAERNLQNAPVLFESHLKVVFAERGKGWMRKRLGDVAEVESGGTPTISRKEFWGGDIPWYSSGELNATHTVDPERLITAAGLAGSNAKLFPKGSLLIGMYDTAALKMSVLDRDGAFNQAIAGVRPNNNVEIEFLMHAINSIKPKLLLARRGVRQRNLSLGKIKDVVLPLPEPGDQRAVVLELRAVLTETRRLESLYQQKLAALTALKTSFLHQALTGDL